MEPTCASIQVLYFSLWLYRQTQIRCFTYYVKLQWFRPYWCTGWLHTLNILWTYSLLHKPFSGFIVHSESASALCPWAAHLELPLLLLKDCCAEVSNGAVFRTGLVQSPVWLEFPHWHKMMSLMNVSSCKKRKKQNKRTGTSFPYSAWKRYIYRIAQV